jgi:hypothetical protein
MNDDDGPNCKGHKCPIWVCDCMDPIRADAAYFESRFAGCSYRVSLVIVPSDTRLKRRKPKINSQLKLFETA